MTGIKEPVDMTPGERFEEIADILADAYLRMKRRAHPAVKPIEMPSERSPEKESEWT